MDVSEYIDVVTGQMRCKRARAMVAKELSDHIADQTEDYVREGREQETAQREAVRQMGDAVEVGMEMDRLHRPRMDKKVIGIVAAFSLVAMFLQTMIVLALRIVGGLDSVSSKMVPFQVLFGILIMVGILYLDYTILGRHPLFLWIVLLCLLIPTVGHVLSNLTLIPYTDIYIPFLYPGWVSNAVSYTLLGLYLSVYRYTDVVA